MVDGGKIVSECSKEPLGLSPEAPAAPKDAVWVTAIPRL
jgi:hypothetical protein